MQIKKKIFQLQIEQKGVGGALAPLEISFSSQTLEASYQETAGSTPFMLLQVIDSGVYIVPYNLIFFPNTIFFSLPKFAMPLPLFPILYFSQQP